MCSLSSPLSSKKFIPWVEKYRPKDFEDIVLDPINRTFFHNMVKLRYFPNLLFYGPPGTGKTTTILSLINKFHTTVDTVADGATPPSSVQNKGLVLHLNASDDRGIDVIRNQINQFVNSRTMFETGMKFVILDEVDYMTKNAQQALRYLLQSSYSTSVRFCLICNYISKIEYSLKNEFICIRFNQLPRQDIYNYIQTISTAENLNLNDKIIYSIQKKFQSDIRSMINFVQTNQNITDVDTYIMDEDIMEEITNMFSSTDATSLKSFKDYLYGLSVKYNSDKREIMKEYFQYIIRTTKDIDGAFLDFVETILHSSGDFDEYVDYIWWGNRRFPQNRHSSPPPRKMV